MIKQRNREEKKGKKALNKEQKAYVKPQLKEYGHIEKLTQSGGSKNMEAVFRRLP